MAERPSASTQNAWMGSPWLMQIPSPPGWSRSNRIRGARTRAAIAITVSSLRSSPGRTICTSHRGRRQGTSRGLMPSR